MLKVSTKSVKFEFSGSIPEFFTFTVSLLFSSFNYCPIAQLVVALVLHTRGHPFDPEEVKSLLNIDGSSKKYKEDIDRKERKYQHYHEMKKWVEESGLNL